MRQETITFDEIPYWYMEIEMTDGNILWVGEQRIDNVLRRYEKYDWKYGAIAKWLRPLFDMFVPDWLLTDSNRDELVRLLNKSPLGKKYTFTLDDDKV